MRELYRIRRGAAADILAGVAVYGISMHPDKQGVLYASIVAPENRLLQIYREGMQVTERDEWPQFNETEPWHPAFLEDPGYYPRKPPGLR